MARPLGAASGAGFKGGNKATVVGRGPAQPVKIGAKPFTGLKKAPGLKAFGSSSPKPSTKGQARGSF